MNFFFIWNDFFLGNVAVLVAVLGNIFYESKIIWFTHLIMHDRKLPSVA